MPRHKDLRLDKMVTAVARASRDVGGVKYILASSVRTTVTHESRGELVEIRLADGNGAG